MSPDENIDQLMKKHLEHATRKMLVSIGEEKIKSIILTGSVTRGEGSGIATDHGIEIFSDYDLMVLVAPSHDSSIDRLRRESAALSEKISEELLGDGLLSGVSIYPLSVDDLESLTPTMFTLQLRNCGKVLYGAECLDVIPDYDVEDIPKIDSLTMLNNRIATQMKFLDPEVFVWKTREDPRQVRMSIYHTAIAFIDLSSSLLNLIGKFQLSYGERAEVFQKEFHRFPYLKEQCPDLPEVVDFFTRLKYDPDLRRVAERYGYGCSDEELVDVAVKVWLELLDYVKPVWAHHVRELCDPGPDAHDVKDLVEAFFRYANTLDSRLVSIIHYLKSNNYSLGSIPRSTRFLSASLPAAVYSTLILQYYATPGILEKEHIDRAPLLSDAQKYLNKLPHEQPPGIFENPIKHWDRMRRVGSKMWSRYIE
ncbi:hypothetical protein H8E65_07755 [Candidatus Bathyarchaeota archaeon]|nr:hypothetical protein [Candidatus Bathyarchaeota archaeon]MBL7078786.1 hypothetical protein [Candidatus Bathyarchaeota archaeon]